jgi:hypothetical protein
MEFERVNVYELREGKIWIATRGGLARRPRGSPTPYGPTSRSRVSRRATTLPRPWPRRTGTGGLRTRPVARVRTGLLARCTKG